MSFGVMAGCASCKIATSQIFINNKKERICAECIQKEHDKAVANIERSFDEMFKLKQQNDMLISALDAVQKIDWSSIIRSHLAQIIENKDETK